MGSLWGHFEGTLGSLWRYSVVTLRVPWGHLGDTLGSLWGYPGVTLGYPKLNLINCYENISVFKTKKRNKQIHSTRTKFQFPMIPSGSDRLWIRYWVLNCIRATRSVWPLKTKEIINWNTSAFIFMNIVQKISVFCHACSTWYKDMHNDLIGVIH